MTEDDARAWIAKRFGPGGVDRLATLAQLVIDENQRQNLISPMSIPAIWARHIVDSAQLLLRVRGRKQGTWLDIGTGAGFPGLVVAALSSWAMHLVEPRKRRAAFLQKAAKALGIEDHVAVHARKVETVVCRADVISARAVAPLGALFAAARSCATRDTVWILPKGRSAMVEVESARQSWHGVFHVEHSVTDPASSIVIASGVEAR